MPDLRELLRRPTGAAQEHRSAILRAIMARSSNQRDLARRCGLSEGTVSTVVTDLEAQGIVSRGNLVSMMPTTGIAVGLELGFHRMAVVARTADQSYDQAVVKTENTGWSDGLNRWLTTAVDLIHAASTEIGEGPAAIATVGLGVPRPVDPRDQHLVPPLFEPGSGVLDPARLLTDRLHEAAPDDGNALAGQLHVLADNDATLGALAESTYGQPGKETLLYVKASTGVGAGVVIGGRAFRGRRGLAGEIGHIVVERGGRFCLCGSRGCLETVVGERVLLDQARQALNDRTLGSIDDLIVRAQNGNVVCLRVLREAAYSLGIILGDICNILNPDVVVLGGALGRGYEIVNGPCRAGMQQSALAAAYDSEYFHLVSTAVPHTASHGALLLGLQGTSYLF